MTNWTRASDPPSTNWARMGESFSFGGWLRDADGFLYFVHGHKEALTFSKDADGFLALGPSAIESTEIQIGKDDDGFLEFVDLED